MKRCVLMTVIMLIVLFMGIGVRGKDVPHPPGNCFWGCVYVQDLHGTYHPGHGITVELFYQDTNPPHEWRSCGTTQTDGQGKYYLWNSAGWPWGNYRIVPRCYGYAKEVYRGDDSDIQVDFYLPFACHVPPGTPEISDPVPQDTIDLPSEPIGEP